MLSTGPPGPTNWGYLGLRRGVHRTEPGGTGCDPGRGARDSAQPERLVDIGLGDNRKPGSAAVCQERTGFAFYMTGH